MKIGALFGELLRKAATYRTALGLGTAAVVDTDDVLLVANDLADLNDAATARTSLGLGALATGADSDDVPYTPGNGGNWVDPDPTTVTGALDTSIARVAAVESTIGGYGTVVTLNNGDVLQKANDLSDLNDAPTARSNLGLGAAAVLGTVADGGVPVRKSITITTGSIAFGATETGNETGVGGNFYIVAGATITRTAGTSTSAALVLYSDDGFSVNLTKVFGDLSGGVDVNPGPTYGPTDGGTPEIRCPVTVRDTDGTGEVHWTVKNHDGANAGTYSIVLDLLVFA